MDIFYTWFRVDDPVCKELTEYLQDKMHWFSGMFKLIYHIIIFLLNIFANNGEDLREYPQLGGFPLFVKPEYGRVDENSIVHNEEELMKRVEHLWREFGTLIIEPYLDGKEYVVLLCGTKRNMKSFKAM